MFTLVIRGIEVRCDSAEDAAQLLTALGAPGPKSARVAGRAKRTARAVAGNPAVPGAAETPARAGRRPMFTDEVIEELHRKYLAGERSADLAEQAGIKLASLYGGWKRLGLKLKRSTSDD